MDQSAIDALKTALSSSGDLNALIKSYTQATGLVNYDLQRPAKLLYPVITPLRNEIPRRRGNGGTATHWKTITGININNVYAGVSEGNRGAYIASQVNDVMAMYKGIGLENYVTFEADYAAQGFDDVRAQASKETLQSVMIQEEGIIVGGNSSLALGTTGTPTLTASASGGSLATGTLSVICVALTLDGYSRSSVTSGIPASITRTNADGSTDTFGGGSAQKSAAATVSVTGPTGSVSASVAVKNGAVAYAWFWGAAGAEALGAITTINSIKITANATGTQTAASLPSSDNSQNSLIFDGLLPQIMTPGSNAYVHSMTTGTAGTGTPLTSDDAAGIVEIDDAFRSFWTNYRVSPNIILVSAQELFNINRKVIAGGGAPLIRLNVDVQRAKNPSDLTIAAGTVVGSYLNKYTMNGGQLVKIVLHPNVPAGTMIFYSNRIPYPLSNVSNPLEIKTRRDYYLTQWPLRTRKYEYGVYADEVLAMYFPPAFGVINNIANG